MEPMNKTQTHQSENVYKTNGNGADFLGCPACDSRACAQANCWRVFYPPFSRCRCCLEDEEDVTLPQPCIFNPQFLHPFFHNGSVSQNYYCNHSGIITNPNSEFSNKDQVNRECGKTRGMVTPHMFCQKMKKKPARGKMNEKNNISENEPSHLPQCQNQSREQSHWNYQSCDCRESFLWTSSPFLIPVVSYCVLWHPQNPNENCSNYSFGQMENLNQKGEDAEGDSFSNSESIGKYDRDMDVENECAQDCSEDGLSKKETDREQNRSSSSFLSLHSSTHNGNKIYNIKKKNSSPSVNLESDDANSEEEATEELQIRCSDSSSNSQNHLSVKSNENILSNAGDYCDIYSAENKSQRSSTAGSEYEMKAEDSSAEAEEVEVEDQTESSGEPTEERNIHISGKSSLESHEEKNPEYNGADTELSTNNLKTKPKMLIKNFTVTNRTESAFQGAPKILAAGGDLGGFKVNIESEETQLENSLTLKVLEEKKPGSPTDKTTNSKALHGCRTGIARLIQDSKSREITKSESKEPVYNDTKRRRFQMREEISKFQKEKNGTALQQKSGPEKHNLMWNLNNRLPNKTKKFSAPKARPHNCERISRK